MGGKQTNKQNELTAVELGEGVRGLEARGRNKETIKSLCWGD